MQDADGEARGQVGLAVARGVQPGHDLQDRRLAGAVRADDADLGAREERHGDVIEDDLVAHGLAGLLHGVDKFGQFSFSSRNRPGQRSRRPHVHRPDAIPRRREPRAAVRRRPTVCRTRWGGRAGPGERGHPAGLFHPPGSRADWSHKVKRRSRSCQCHGAGAAGAPGRVQLASGARPAQARPRPAPGRAARRLVVSVGRGRVPAGRSVGHAQDRPVPGRRAVLAHQRRQVRGGRPGAGGPGHDRRDDRRGGRRVEPQERNRPGAGPDAGAVRGPRPGVQPGLRQRHQRPGHQGQVRLAAGAGAAGPGRLLRQQHGR